MKTPSQNRSDLSVEQLEDRVMLSGLDSIYETTFTESSLRELNDSVVVGDQLYFPANSGPDETSKMFVTDGTEEGTQNVFDFEESVRFLRSEEFNGAAYFVISQDDRRSLWKFEDGNARKLLSRTSFSSLDIVSEELYFLTKNSAESVFELWKTDGTQLTLVDSLPSDRTSSARMHVSGESIFVDVRGDRNSSQNELWISDGTEEGARLLMEANLSSDITSFDGKSYFSVTNSASEDEFWVFDGTTGETEILANIDVDSNIIEFNEKLYFVGENSSRKDELWESDGTADGTRRVRMLRSLGGPRLHLFDENSFAISTTRSLLRSDGTAEGTEFIRGFSTQPLQFHLLNGKLFFNAAKGKSEHGFGLELWESDLTKIGTKVSFDVRKGTAFISGWRVNALE